MGVQHPHSHARLLRNARSTTRGPKHLSKLVGTCTAQAWDAHDAAHDTNPDCSPINPTAEVHLPDQAVCELFEMCHIQNKPRPSAHTPDWIWPLMWPPT